MPKYSQYELNSAWGFAYLVKRFVADKYWVRPMEVARHFGVPRVQADLALRLLCAIQELDRRDGDGRYYVVSEEEKKRRQTILLAARGSL